MTPVVHVYRNRPDDDRTREELKFCGSCGGWYGVSHEYSHCQHGRDDWRSTFCACRFCCVRDGRPVEGRYGFYTSDERWQP